MAEKMMKGTEVLKDIKEIDIATTPKTAVHLEDKLVLYQLRPNETPPT